MLGAFLEHSDKWIWPLWHVLCKYQISVSSLGWSMSEVSQRPGEGSTLMKGSFSPMSFWFLLREWLQESILYLKAGSPFTSIANSKFWEDSIIIRLFNVEESCETRPFICLTVSICTTQLGPLCCQVCSLNWIHHSVCSKPFLLFLSPQPYHYISFILWR